MASKKYLELQDMSEVDIAAELAKTEKEYQKLKFDHAVTGLENPLRVCRYHSLVVDKQTLPNELTVTAWTEVNHDLDEIMGLMHRNLALEGVQFHPEAILTEQGLELLANFLTRF